MRFEELTDGTEREVAFELGAAGGEGAERIELPRGGQEARLADARRSLDKHHASAARGGSIGQLGKSRELPLAFHEA